MDTPASSELNLPRPASLAWACAILAGVLLGLLPVFALTGYFLSGTVGIAAAVVACAICLACGLLALAITSITQKMNQGVQGILLAMMVRMCVPLGALIILPEIGGPLIAGGVTGMLMAYYLITLTVETWLSLRFVPATKNSGAKSSAAKVA